MRITIKSLLLFFSFAAFADTPPPPPVNFINSLVQSGRNVSLKNDTALPGANVCYSTNGSGTTGWFSCAAGSVTSVGMSVPAFLSVSPSTITSSGTFAVTFSGTAIPTVNGGTGVTSLANLTDGGTDGIIVTGGTGSVINATSLSQHVADSTHNGYLSSTDWSTFNGKQSTLTLGNISDAGTDGISISGGTGAIIGSGVTVSQQVADTTHAGYLSSSDWNSFTAKQSALTFTTPLVNTTGTVSCNSASGSQAGCLSSANFTTFNGKQSALTFSDSLVNSGGTVTLVNDSASPGNSMCYSTNASGVLGWNACSSGGGGGTVTSVGLTVPTFLSVTPATITSSGTFSVSLSGTALPALNGGTGVTALGTLSDAGTDGITVTGGTGSVINATSLAQHVADTTHNGYLGSTDWNTFNGKQASGSYITALSGDGTATGPGSSALTLATVNAGPGSVGSSTAIPVLTTNGKGLVTAQSTAVVIAPAGTLSGTTLNSTVVTSSLTSVGSIGTGTWGGTTVAVNHGGTGVTSVTTSPTASAWAGWDASKNFSANNLVEGFTTTATAAGTTTMTITSTGTQYWTGTTTQTVKLPTTSIAAGATYLIENRSTGVVTVQSSGANSIQAMAANTSLLVTALVATPTTAANWDAVYLSTTDANALTSLSGDVTATGPTSTATLATVNTNVGSFTVGNFTVNGKGLITAASSTTTGNLTDAGTDGITVTSGTGAVLGSGTSIAQQMANTTNNGYLASTDWNTFNGKQSALTFANSLVNTSGTVALSGDTSSPGNSFCYSTNVSGVKGWNACSSGGSGTVTSIVFSSPLTGGTITSSGTVGLGSVAGNTSIVKAPTIQTFTSTGTQTGTLFTVTGWTGTIVAGDTYTNNSHTFTAIPATQTNGASGQTLFMSCTTCSTSGTTLTKGTSASGPATITFSAGASLATYTLPTSPSPISLHVRMVGGGAGGSGSGTSVNVGTSGTASAFGALLLQASGGLAGSAGTAGGAGGSATLNGVSGLALSGGGGQNGGVNSSATATPGGMGGGSAFGGAGGGVTVGAGNAASANTGSGGGGSGANEVTSGLCGGGGGSGGYVDATIVSPASTYFYATGAAGSGGSAGTSGSVGGAGSAGIIIVEEHYQ